MRFESLAMPSLDEQSKARVQSLHLATSPRHLSPTSNIHLRMSVIVDDRDGQIQLVTGKWGQPAGGPSQYVVDLFQKKSDTVYRANSDTQGIPPWGHRIGSWSGMELHVSG